MHTYFSLAIGILITLPVGIGKAAALDVPPSVEQWDVEEITLTSSYASPNPFRDVTVMGHFRSHSGHEVTVPGFFDGAQLWKLRFMPDETGTWTYRTESKDPQLNGKSGSFTVTPAGDGNHGPVRVQGKYHFSYADGTPFFLLGTTEYGGLIGGPASRVRALSRIAHSPFNKARFMLLGRGFFSGPNSPAPFQLDASGKMDHSRPNPEYFRSIEAGLRELQSIGIEADLILFNPYMESMGPDNLSDMGPADDAAFVKYVAARFAAFRNVWWTMSNEFDLYKKQKDWLSLGKVLTDADPYHHLTSNHHSILAFYDNRQSWITHVNIQDVTLQRLASGPRNEGIIELDARKIGKPVVVDEYGYEGNNGFTWGSFSGREIVNMHWSLTIAGAYASHGESYFGTNDSPDFAGEAPPRLGFLKKILTEAPYQQMEPDNDILEYKGTAFVPTALAEKGRYYLIYIPAPRELPDWNTGFFGPGTPSNPTPLPKSVAFSMTATQIHVAVEPGSYQVDLIDPWQMKVVKLGYTENAKLAITPRLTPGVVRLIRVQSIPAGATVGDFPALMRKVSRF